MKVGHVTHGESSGNRRRRLLLTLRKERKKLVQIKLKFTPKEHAKLLIHQSSRSNQYIGHFDCDLKVTFFY